MKPAITLILVLWQLLLACQVKFCSWNIANFGQSKSDSEIVFIANTLRDFDVVAIVEVVAGNGGAQAIARLADQLNRMGSKWDYVVSDPTTGSPGRVERYAFLWKPSRVKKTGDAWLEQKYQAEMEREPYLINMVYEDKPFTLGCFHAITKAQQPEKEIKYFKFITEMYQNKNLIFGGDFNCPESHSVFIPVKSQGFKPALSCQKTSLKQECRNGENLASEFDNIFYQTSKNKVEKAGIILFYESFASLQLARRISDHVPVYLEFFPL
jgi:deoxyribonuclease-1-like protein